MNNDNNPCYTRYSYANSYGNIELDILYPYCNLSNDEIISGINSSNDTIYLSKAKTINHYYLKINRISLPIEDYVRFTLYMKIQQNDIKSGITFYLTYDTPNEYTEYVHDDRSREEVLNEINVLFELDNHTIMKYVSDLHHIIKPIIGHDYSYRYEEIYIFDECCSSSKYPC